MKKFALITLLASCLAAPLSQAETSAAEEAETLLGLLHMETALQQSIEQMVEGEILQNPQLTPFRPILQKFFTQHMGYASLRPELIKVYTDRFSRAELVSINQFYRSTTGQKFIAQMPEIMQISGEIGETRMREHIAEFEQMVDAEAKRLEAADKAAAEPAF